MEEKTISIYIYNCIWRCLDATKDDPNRRREILEAIAEMVADNPAPEHNHYKLQQLMKRCES